MSDRSLFAEGPDDPDDSSTGMGFEDVAKSPFLKASYRFRTVLI